MKTENGFFPGQIPYARVGSGPKHVIYLTGGPGNDTPHGTEASMTLGALKKEREFSFWVTSRRNGQPDGYGTREMAADTASAIRETFPDGVTAVMGISYGGLIAQYIAADFPGLVPKYVLIAAAHRVAEEVITMDMRFAELLAAGKTARALASIAGYLARPGIRRTATRIVMYLVGALAGGKHHADFEKDVINEGVMEARHDSLNDLGRISDSVLMVGGDADVAFPRELMEESASAIPGARLILYPDRGHGGVTNHPDFARDVLEFLA